MKTARPRTRRAFTLTELLVVITIIAILSTIVTVVSVKVIIRVKEAAIGYEINEMGQAIEAYRKKHNGYPVDFSNVGVFKKHLRKAFPNHTYTDTFLNDWYNNKNLDSSEALVFFLGGGLKNNSERPLGPGKPKIFYEFDKARLVDPDGDGIFSYLSKYGKQIPFVYFDSRTYGNANAVFPKPANAGSPFGNVRPYRTNVPDPSLAAPDPTMPASYPWASANKFQIISAGLDTNFGSNTGNKQYPGSQYYSIEDRDNIANFSNGKNFEDQIP